MAKWQQDAKRIDVTKEDMLGKCLSKKEILLPGKIVKTKGGFRKCSRQIDVVKTTLVLPLLSAICSLPSIST